MDIIILSGMSGSGKSVAAKALEDIGYFCIDNLPPQLLGDTVLKLNSLRSSSGSALSRLAVVLDSRSAAFFTSPEKSLQDSLRESLRESLRPLKEAGLPFRIIFLDSSDETLISRYNLSRRNHPLAEEGGIASGIRKERELLKPLKQRADIVLCTDRYSPRELASHIRDLAEQKEGAAGRIHIIMQSFGFKYGVPEDSDLVLDVRFLPNPYYVDELRPLSGLDQPIADYIYSFPETEIFLQKQSELLLFLIPYYIREGKMSLTISAGCTGGRHRSVLLAEALGRVLKQNNYRVTIVHRDITKDLQK